MPYLANMQALLKNWVEKSLFYSINNTSFGANLSFRRRCTAAEINAGQVLLPPHMSFGYRLIDCAMIAVGGAAAGATSVDITGTQTTNQKLVSAAVAGLTQSTYLRAGAANAAILADGASFLRNDLQTAISISKTGSPLTGATAIDVILTYVVERG